MSKTNTVIKLGTKTFWKEISKKIRIRIVWYFYMELRTNNFATKFSTCKDIN